MQLHPAGLAQSIGESGPRHCMILHGIHQQDSGWFSLSRVAEKPLELVDTLAIECRLHIKQRCQVRVDATSLDGKSIAHCATQHQKACQALHCYMGAIGAARLEQKRLDAFLRPLVASCLSDAAWQPL